MTNSDISFFEVNRSFADSFTVSLAGVAPENGITFDIAPAPLNAGLCFCVSGGSAVYSFISDCEQQLAKLCFVISSTVQKIYRAAKNNIPKISKRVRMAALCVNVPRVLRL